MSNRGTEMADDISNVELATELTVAWLGNSNTRVQADDVPRFLKSMHDALNGLSSSGAGAESAAPEEAPQEHTPAVSAKKSLATPNHILSMIDGKQYKTLRRHLSRHGLTPDEYRTRYGLKKDYPMVAQAYSEVRRAMAKQIGLGRKAGEKVKQVAEEAAAPVKAVAKRARKGIAAAKQAAREHLGGQK